MSIKNEKELVIIVYPNQWHWVLSLEYVALKKSEGLSVEVLDLSWCGEIGFRSIIKRLIFFWTFQRNCINWLDLNAIKHTKAKLIFKRKQKLHYANEKHLTQADCGPSFNSIVERTGSLLVNVEQSKKIVREEFWFMESTRKRLKEITPDLYDSIVTVNGRFTKNATVVEWGKIKSKTIKLIEFGASQDKLEIYWVSPHSMEEQQQKIETVWQSANSKERLEVATKGMDSFADAITGPKNIWRTKMMAGLSPRKSHKKRCVFFASTEAEYAGVGDSIPVGNFRNQVEGFRGLLSCLDPSEWEIFLRRHPKNPKALSSDPEEHLWREFEENDYIHILPPDSEIDSIELARSADLSVNYCSTIAMELIASGIGNVITLGPAPWNKLLPTRFCPNNGSINVFLRQDQAPAQSSDVLPWIFFTTTFGHSFKIFRFIPKGTRWQLI